MSTATQTLADLAARVGSKENARMVLGNLNCRIILRAKDQTARHVLQQGTTRGAMTRFDADVTSNTGDQPASDEDGGIP